MKKFEPILDAYQLAEGSIIKEKDQDEIFELGEYDADKKGYTVFPFEDGIRFEDFTMVISEEELMDNYLIESKKGDDEDDSEGPMLSDSL
ncbi:MAG: hypothetical protein ACHQHN_13545 [Sphingobacteriales bacterium]